MGGIAWTSQEPCTNCVQGKFEFRGKRRGDTISEW